MKFRYLAVALLGYVFFLVLTAPAAWTALLVARFSHGALGVARPAGSFWTGHGTVYLKRVDGVAVSVGVLSWQLRPAAVLLGRAEARVTMTGPLTAHVRIDRSWGRITLSDVSLQGPASELARLDSDLRLFEPSGALQLASRRLILTPESIQGRVRLDWSGAGTSVSSVHPLGDYTVVGDGAGSRLNIQLHSAQGPLALTGHGYWDNTGAFQFSGTAASTTGDRRIDRLVRFMGRPLRPHVGEFVLNEKTVPWRAFL